MRALLAHWHHHFTGHRIWSEKMHWSEGSAVVWFCHCGKAWWPTSAHQRHHDPIHREPPWERRS